MLNLVANVGFIEIFWGIINNYLKKCHQDVVYSPANGDKIIKLRGNKYSIIQILIMTIGYLFILDRPEYNYFALTGLWHIVIWQKNLKVLFPSNRRFKERTSSKESNKNKNVTGAKLQSYKKKQD